jgi:glycosyltransferase involved in cell wall biosynthesis
LRRALILVHWLTDFGGLHENVLETAAGLVAGGWQVTVMAPPNKVGARFAAAGVNLFEDSMEDTAASASRALSSGTFDLVHAHPFQARRVGMVVAKALGVPLLVTLHGQYEDEFEQYRASVHRIICVSAAVAALVARRDPALVDRLSIIPNGVDFEVFTPRPMPRSAARTTIAIASRLDPDKGVLARVVEDLVGHLCDTGAPGQFELRVAGDRLYGPPDNPFTAALESAATSSAIELQRFGWINDRAALQRFFAAADVVVAPGRAAMEAVACAVPTIAVGSRGYIGLVTRDTLALAHATNFGGIQQEATAYLPGMIVEHFRRALAMPQRRAAELRQHLQKVHDLLAIQAAHLALYENACISGRTA